MDMYEQTVKLQQILTLINFYGENLFIISKETNNQNEKEGLIAKSDQIGNFNDNSNPVMKGMELSSSDQQTTARCKACDTADEELARSGSTCEPLSRCRLSGDAERSDDGLKKTVDGRMTVDG